MRTERPALGLSVWGTVPRPRFSMAGILMFMSTASAFTEFSRVPLSHVPFAYSIYHTPQRIDEAKTISLIRFSSYVLILDKTSRVFYILIMLRLSTKGQYGVRAMFEIARGYPENPLTIKEISERQDVSVAYLEQILNKLRKAGIVRSVKGPGGGYLLAREPGHITIAEILKELEGPVAITSCLDPEEGCSRVEGCVTHLLWRSLGAKIEAFLETITLKDLLEKEPILKGVDHDDSLYRFDVA